MIVAYVLYFVSIFVTYLILVRDYVQGTAVGYKFSKRELAVGFILLPYIPILNLVLAFAILNDPWEDKVP